MIKFQQDLSDPSSRAFNIHPNALIKKDKLKKLFFNIIRKKLNFLEENYLLTIINWLEKETIETQNQNKNNILKNYTELKNENEEYQTLYNFLSDYTNIKLKPDTIAEYNLEKLQNKPISLSTLKKFSQNKSQNINLIPTEPEKYILFSEESINKIETQEFNIFKLEEEVGAENTLSVISCYIFNSNNLYSYFNYNKFENFLQAITKGYNRENPYHTDLHAADVTQTSMLYTKKANLVKFLKLNPLDIASLYISCIVHDYKHPGYTNQFLININSPISIRSNDTDVLEAYHISQTFKLIMSNEKYNIFSELNNENYRLIRKRMIGCVLATDMIFHNKQFNFVKDNITNFNISKGENRDKILENVNEKIFEVQQDFLEILIHACDISNPTKPFNIYTFWADKVVTEFFRQGDKEKELGLKVSMNCDRLTVSKAQSQIGFMNFIVLPFFNSLTEIFPELIFLSDNVKNNIEVFKKIKEKEDKEKEEKK